MAPPVPPPNRNKLQNPECWANAGLNRGSNICTSCLGIHVLFPSTVLERNVTVLSQRMFDHNFLCLFLSLLLMFSLGLFCIGKNNSFIPLLQSLNICIPSKTECLCEESYQKHMYELRSVLHFQIKTPPKHSGGRKMAAEIFK